MPDPSIPSPPRMRHTLVGAACLAMQPMLLNVLSVPALAYIIRRLGSDAYGQWMAPAAVLAIGSMAANLGLRGAFVRRVAARPDTAALAVGEQLGLRLLLAIPAATLAVVVCVLLDYPMTTLWCAAIGAIGLVLTTISTTFADALQALHRITTLAIVNLAAGMALTAASIAAAFFHPSPAGVAIAYLTGPLVAALALGMTVRRRIGRVRLHGSLPRYRALLRDSRFLAAQQALAVGSAQIEALLLPRLVGLEAFGVFTAGAIPANRLTALPDGLCTAVYPVLSRACVDNTRAASRLVRRYLLIAALGGATVSTIGSAMADPVGRLLVPNDPDGFALVMRITLWALPLVCVDAVLGYALNAAGRDSDQARLMVLSTVAGLAGSVALVVSFGVTGACWSMLLRPGLRATVLIPTAVRAFRVQHDASPPVGAGSRIHVEITAATSRVAA